MSGGNIVSYLNAGDCLPNDITGHAQGCACNFWDSGFVATNQPCNYRMCTENDYAPRGSFCTESGQCTSGSCAYWGGMYDYEAHCSASYGESCGWGTGHTLATIGQHCWPSGVGHNSWNNWASTDVTYCASGLSCSSNQCQYPSGRRLQQDRDQFWETLAAVYNVSVEAYKRGTIEYSWAPNMTGILGNPTSTFKPRPPPAPPRPPPGPLTPPPGPPPPPSPPPIQCLQMQNRSNTVLLNTTTYQVDTNTYSYVFCFHLNRSTHSCSNFFSMTTNNYRMRTCHDPGSGSFCEASGATICNFLPPAPPPAPPS